MCIIIYDKKKKTEAGQIMCQHFQNVYRLLKLQAVTDIGNVLLQSWKQKQKLKY